MIFNGTGHKTRFGNEVMKFKGKCRFTKNFLSAIYLLTSYKNLWHRASAHIEPNLIKFEEINRQGVNPQEYAVFMMAQDLFSGTDHIAMSEICDTQVMDDTTVDLIFTAVTIRRCGYLNSTNVK